MYLQVYHTELEEVECFNGFNDFMATFDLLRGKKTEDEDDLQRRFSGKVKVIVVLSFVYSSVVVVVYQIVIQFANYTSAQSVSIYINYITIYYTILYYTLLYIYIYI